jgi:hypothetical protein
MVQVSLIGIAPTLMQLGYEVKFGDIKHFCIVFVTPVEFRQMSRPTAGAT